MLVTTKCLLRQTYLCCDKHNLVTKRLLWQAYFCHDKLVFVVTKHIFCHDKSMRSMTKLLSRQAHVCHNFCHTKHTFVTTKDVFFRQKKNCFVVTNMCLSQKTFVTTKIILVAAMIQTWSFITESHDPQWLMELAQILSHFLFFYLHLCQAHSQRWQAGWNFAAAAWSNLCWTPTPPASTTSPCRLAAPALVCVTVAVKKSPSWVLAPSWFSFSSSHWCCTLVLVSFENEMEGCFSLK